MIQAIVPSRGRVTIRMGDAPERVAERFKGKVEDLIACRRLNLSPDPETAAWVAGLDGDLYGALVSAGLAELRERGPVIPAFKAFVDGYIESKRPELAERSVELLEQTRDRLVAAIGAATPIDKVTAAMALDWRSGMLKTGVSEAYVRMHSRNAKSMFNEAVRRELLTKNPFKLLPSAAIAADRSFYLTEADAEKLLAKLGGDDLRLFFGLMRYGGLRAPSETHILTWAQVDLPARMMTVFAPKTGQTRVVPIVPRLAELLEAARPRKVEPGTPVLNLSLHNLHKKVLDAIDAAGMDRWNDLFQTLRRAAATDFARKAPPHVVASWLGHGVQVSAQHYLQVPAEMFELVTGSAVQSAASRRPRKPAPTTAAGRSALQNALQHGAAQSGISLQTKKSLKIAG